MFLQQGVGQMRGSRSKFNGAKAKGGADNSLYHGVLAHCLRKTYVGLLYSYWEWAGWRLTWYCDHRKTYATLEQYTPESGAFSIKDGLTVLAKLDRLLRRTTVPPWYVILVLHVWRVLPSLHLWSGWNTWLYSLHYLQVAKRAAIPLALFMYICSLCRYVRMCCTSIL